MDFKEFVKNTPDKISTPHLNAAKNILIMKALKNYKEA